MLFFFVVKQETWEIYIFYFASNIEITYCESVRSSIEPLPGLTIDRAICRWSWKSSRDFKQRQINFLLQPQ